MPSLWRHLQKTPNRKRKTFLSISTRRLAESVDGLNSSLAAGDFWPKKGRPIAAGKGSFLSETATQHQVIDFFYHHDFAKFYSPPCDKPQSHDVKFCMWSLSECNTKLWMLQLHVFWPLGFGVPQMLNKLCVVLSVIGIFSCKVFQILRKNTYGHWMFWQGNLIS